MYFRILFFNYLKNFLIILLSLTMFFIFMDFMINKDKLPDSSNLQLLYIFYNGLNATILIYPLSLFLGVLVTTINLVRKNEMIAFLSLGYSLKKLLLPIFSVTLIVSIFFIAIQMFSSNSFASVAQSILKGKYFSNVNKNLFFKFNDNIIFIQKLDIVKKTAYGMKIFEIKNKHLNKVFEIEKGYFKNNYWTSDNIVEYEIKNDKILKTTSKIDLLKGFKPKILNTLEARQNMSLKLAIEALYLLKKENINLNFIKTFIYNALIPPLSFILLIIIVFLNAPIHSRISNVSLFLAISIFSAIILWSMFLLIRKVSLSGIISPDIAFLTPLLILLSLTIYYFRKI